MQRDWIRSAARSVCTQTASGWQIRCKAAGLSSPSEGGHCRRQVLSGQLVAPELPEPVERTEMEDLVDTYGKTIHTWQIDRGDTLPLGALPGPHRAS